MSEQKRTSIYLTETDRDRLAWLKSNYGLGVSAATRAGLALLERQMRGGTMEHRGFDSEDRVEQHNYLRSVAGDIRLYGEGYGTPEEQVAYWEGEGQNLPAWYDQHDRALLIGLVSDD